MSKKLLTVDINSKEKKFKDIKKFDYEDFPEDSFPNQIIELTEDKRILTLRKHDKELEFHVYSSSDFNDFKALNYEFEAKISDFKAYSANKIIILLENYKILVVEITEEEVKIVKEFEIPDCDPKLKVDSLIVCPKSEIAAINFKNRKKRGKEKYIKTVLLSINEGEKFEILDEILMKKEKLKRVKKFIFIGYEFGEDFLFALALTEGDKILFLIYDKSEKKFEEMKDKRIDSDEEICDIVKGNEKIMGVFKTGEIFEIKVNFN